MINANDFFYLCFYALASGPGRCKLNNGGCWKETQDGLTYSACQVGSVFSR